MSCSSHMLYDSRIFSKPLAKTSGFSKKDDPRLITVNDSTPTLVIPIGGQFRTVVD